MAPAGREEPDLRHGAQAVPPLLSGRPPCGALGKWGTASWQRDPWQVRLSGILCRSHCVELIQGFRFALFYA